MDNTTKRHSLLLFTHFVIYIYIYKQKKNEKTIQNITAQWIGKRLKIKCISGKKNTEKKVHTELLEIRFENQVFRFILFLVFSFLSIVFTMLKENFRSKNLLFQRHYSNALLLCRVNTFAILK